MHTHMHTHTYSHTRTHTDTRAQTERKREKERERERERESIPLSLSLSHTHTRTHTHTHMHTHALSHTHTHTLTHSRTHTHTHTRTHTHTHTHTHTCCTCRSFRRFLSTARHKKRNVRLFPSSKSHRRPCVKRQHLCLPSSRITRHLCPAARRYRQCQTVTTPPKSAWAVAHRWDRQGPGPAIPKCKLCTMTKTTAALISATTL